MPSLHSLMARHHDDPAREPELSPLMMNLLIALLALVFVGLASVGLLLVLRHMRRAQKQRSASELPMFHPNAPHDAYLAQGRGSSHHRRLTITATPASFAQADHSRRAARPESLYVFDEKKALFAQGPSPPASPIPEIRITLPEEVDDSGKRLSGRVVVVRVGETGVGLEPLNEDLPPYERREGEGGFQSLDLERMGGLKEKEMSILDEKRWS